MLGVKTTAAIVALVLAIQIAITSEVIGPEELSRLEPATALLIGLFASIGAALATWILQLRGPSENYIRLALGGKRSTESVVAGAWGRGLVVGRSGGARPRDLPTPAIRLIYVAIALLLGLVVFDNRATALLAESPSRLLPAASQFCSEAEAETAVEPAIAQGCALVFRAYELGYAKSLGSCAPATAEATPKPCTLRRRDEPGLHYSWRLLDQRVPGISGWPGLRELEGKWRDLGSKLEHVGALVARQRHLVSASPHGSHHLWTNLARPSTSLAERLTRAHCSRRYHEIPYGLRETSSVSRALDDAVGRLLFSQKYRPVVGYCKELTVHWGAPADACRRLVEAPAEFLSASTALEPVRSVLERRRLERELGRVPRPKKPPSDHDRIASFQCLMVDRDGAGEVTVAETAIEGLAFSVREIRARDLDSSASGQVAAHKHLAALLAPGFHYGPFSSRASPARGREPVVSADVEATPPTLAALEFLRTADVFVGERWILERPELVEVYPFHLHLRNFIEMFRRHYAQHRGRL